MKTLLLMTALSAFCLSSMTGCLIIAKGDCKCCQNNEKNAAPVKTEVKGEAKDGQKF